MGRQYSLPWNDKTAWALHGEGWKEDIKFRHFNFSDESFSLTLTSYVSRENLGLEFYSKQPMTSNSAQKIQTNVC